MMLQAPNTARQPPSRSSVAVVALLLLVGLLIVAVRLRLAGVPLERDEGEYAYAGRLLLEGVFPYAHAYNMKFPGAYFTYAGILAIFGQTPSAIRIGLLVCNLATAGFLFLLGRRLLKTWVAAIAAAIFLLLAASPSVLGLFGHVTHFILLPVLLGTWLLVPPREESTPGDAMPMLGALPGRGRLLLSGTCFGIALLLKQHAVFYPLAGALLIAWRAKPPSPASRDLGVRPARRPGLGASLSGPLGWFALGVALPLAVTAGLLVSRGVWDRFWFWTFEYAREYVSITPLRDALGTLGANGRHVMRGSEPFWILALVGLIARANGASKQERVVVLVLLGASLLAIVPGFYFRPHYFILLLPPVALLAARGIEAVSIWIARAFGKERTALVTAGALALFTAAAAVQLGVWRDALFRLTPREVSRSLYGPDPFPESEVIAEYIQRETGPEDLIAVVGSEPQIYFLARRPAATGYLYTYALMESQPFARRMQEEMIEEIETSHPTLLVYAKIGTSWSRQEESDPAIFDWIGRYARECYDLVGIVDVHSPERSTIVWGDDTRDYRPQSENLVFVFRRKSDAPCS